VDGDLNRVLPQTNNVVGIDMGIKDFIVTSDGEKFENIKLKRNNKRRIARLHRRLSRKKMLPTGRLVYSKKWSRDVEVKESSKNREKARIKLARFYEKLNNKKENYLHEVANKLLNENQVIVMENLNVFGMLKNHNIARSMQELSLYRFKEILKYKAAWYGRDVVEIDRWFPSSKLCSTCGNKNTELTLKDRLWTCSKCNTKHDRDYNAALNIKKEGLRVLT
jgi:putative transposase